MFAVVVLAILMLLYLITVVSDPLGAVSLPYFVLTALVVIPAYYGLRAARAFFRDPRRL